MAMSLFLLIIKHAFRENTEKKYRRHSLNPKSVPSFSHLVELITDTFTCQHREINIIFTGVQLFGNAISV